MEVVALSCIEEQALLEWIRDNDMLFNKKSSNCIDTVKKEVWWRWLILKLKL